MDRSIVEVRRLTPSLAMRAWPGRDTWLGILLVVVIGVLVLVPVGFIILGSFNTARPGEPLRLSIDPWRQALQSS